MEDTSYISAQDLLARIGEQVESNAIMASRMPPGMSCGLHPTGFYDVYEKGGLLKEFQSQLGEPVHRPQPAFNVASAAEAPTNNVSLNPKTFT